MYNCSTIFVVYKPFKVLNEGNRIDSEMQLPKLKESNAIIFQE